MNMYQKVKKNTEAANELSRKLEESTKSVSSVVSGYSSKIEKIDKIDTKIDKIVQTTDKITASVKENNPTAKMDSIIKSLNTIQDNQKKILSNQDKMLKHQSLEILDHVSFYWNRFLEATKNVFTEMESFLQSNFPQQFEAVTSKLPSRKKITKKTLGK